MFTFSDHDSESVTPALSKIKFRNLEGSLVTIYSAMMKFLARCVVFSGLGACEHMNF